MEIGLKRKTVRIEDYNPKWKDYFQEEKERISKKLANNNIVIEHVGSTSIVGCAAKPIIDIAIGVPTLEYGKQLIPLLQEIGWTYDGTSDFGVRWFLKKCQGEIRTHYMHIEDINSRIWQHHIVFRDYMNLHPEKVKEYSNLKKKLEKEYANDRDGYIERKSPFIKQIIDDALKEFNIEPKGKSYTLK